MLLALNSGPQERQTLLNRSIPLINNVISDRQLQLASDDNKKPIELDRIIELLTDKHCIHLTSRHLSALRKVQKFYKNGYFYKDIFKIFRIINIITDRSETQPAYFAAIDQMVQLCCFPFLKEKASDEIIYQEIASQAISQLGYLMRVHNDKIKDSVCQVLLQFYTGEREPDTKLPSLSGAEYSTVDVCQRLVEQSDCADSFVRSFALIENSFPMKLAIMNLLLRLSRNSGVNCQKMLTGGAVREICARIVCSYKTDDERTLVFIAVELLWNILESVNSATHLGGAKSLLPPSAKLIRTPAAYSSQFCVALVAKQLSDRACLNNLKDIFYERLCKSYHSLFERQLRNDILCCLCLMVQICGHECPFIETGLAKQLVLFATFEEVKSHNALVKHLRLGTFHEDFELKKLLWSLLIDLAQRESAILPLLSDGQLLLALFTYCVPIEYDPKKAMLAFSSPRQWSYSQFEELQLLALALLESISPLLIDDFVQLRGNSRLLSLMDWAQRLTDDRSGFRGFGNAYHATGGRGCGKAQILRSVRVLKTVCCADTRVAQDLCDQGGIETLIGLHNSLALFGANERAIDVEICLEILMLLSALCGQDNHRKELFGEPGVKLCLELMRQLPQRLTSGLGYNKIIVATLDVIWSCIVGCYLNEDLFLEHHGAFVLFDLMQNCPSAIRSMALGLVSDLVQNTKTMAHIVTWRGQKDATLPHVLCELWRADERELGVQRLDDGTIADTSRPLLTQFQLDHPPVSVPTRASTVAITDVFENSRAKIYSIMLRLGFYDAPGLQHQDYVTITMMERYLDFKVAEVWTEIRAELVLQDIEPTSADSEVLRLVEQGSIEKAVETRELQLEINKSRLQQDIAEEQEYYAQVRERSRQRDRAFAYFDDLVQRTSKYHALKAAKSQQRRSIEASRISENYRNTAQFHLTDLETLNITALSSRHLHVESTPSLLTGGALADYDAAKGTLLPKKH